MRSLKNRQQAETRYLLSSKFTQDDIDNCAFPKTVQQQRCKDATIAFSAGWANAVNFDVSEESRSEIAVQAMVGLLSSQGPDEVINTKIIAAIAYAMADDMIEAAKQ